MRQETVPIGNWLEDPDFVRVYDVENAGMWDHEFYTGLALELGAQHVADIGSGTGVFGTGLAEHGAEVVGVEPARTMIGAARSRTAALPWTTAARLRWIHGFADQLPSTWADFAIMEGHVAQYFLQRAEWDEVLAQSYRTLIPGGYLAFESRNPGGLVWDDWDEEHTRETQPHPDGGEFTSWVELEEIVPDEDDGDLTTHRGHIILPDGRHLVTEETLRFRPLHVLRESVESAGFRIIRIWGDWDRSPLEEDSPEIIMLAQKRG